MYYKTNRFVLFHIDVDVDVGVDFDVGVYIKTMREIHFN